MNIEKYQRMAMRTASGGRDEPTESKLLNGILGLVGEVGEVVDHIKKVIFQGHDLNTELITEELGDILWYVALLSNGIGVSLDVIMKENIVKLKRRYPDGFDADRSKNREG